MVAPAKECTALSVIRDQGQQSLLALEGKLSAHSSADVLHQYELLENALKNVPDMYMIAIDRSGSGDNDLATMEKRIGEIRTNVGKDDCPVVMFGDAYSSSNNKMWEEGMAMAHTTLDGNGNGHEGGLQAVLWGLEQKGVILEERDIESPPIHAFILTDEHADGVLGSEIINRAAQSVTDQQVDTIFEAFKATKAPGEGIANKKTAVELDFDVKRSSTAANIESITRRLSDAHVILHVITPHTNLEDYPISWGGESVRKKTGIHLLGQIWQAIAAMTGGDWADLEKEFIANGTNIAQTVADIHESAIAGVKGLLVDTIK